MSSITRAMDNIKLAAAEPGVAGVGDLAERAGMNIDTARRLLRKPPAAITNLKRLEDEALKILGERAQS